MLQLGKSDHYILVFFITILFYGVICKFPRSLFKLQRLLLSHSHQTSYTSYTFRCTNRRACLLQNKYLMLARWNEKRSRT